MPIEIPKKIESNFKKDSNNEACPVCQSIEIKLVAPYRCQSAVFKNTSIAECTSCGMVFATPMPPWTILEAYNADYFSRAHGGVATDMIAVAFFNAISKLRINYLMKYIDKLGISIGNVLEFGPGPGYFAKNWLNSSLGTSYFAIETDKSCHEALRKIGVNLIKSEVDIPVDLIVLSHVLEHVSNPIDFINNAFLNLKSGGVIFIEVPCQDWVHKDIDEPHVLFFEKKSMQKLLADQGFVDIELGYFGQPISDLKNFSVFQKFWRLLRIKLIKIGLVPLFSNPRIGMECLNDPLERAVVAPFFAHQESKEPAWWLRVLARKV